MKNTLTIIVFIFSSIASFGQLVSQKAEVAQPMEKYKRSSLYTIIMPPKGNYSAEILTEFLNMELPDKYNTINLPNRVLTVSGTSDSNDFQKSIVQRNVQALLSSMPSLKSGSGYGAFYDHCFFEDRLEDFIMFYLDRENVARNIVSEWYNRDENGAFNMDLIEERGVWNEGYHDLMERKMMHKADAQRTRSRQAVSLIGNSFVLINDISYIDKEKRGKNVGAGIAMFGAFAGGVAGGMSPNSSTGEAIQSAARIAQGAASVASTVSNILAKGFRVKVTSYLFQINWNAKTEEEFNSRFYMESGEIDPAKVRAFDNTNMFSLSFIGKQSAKAAIQSTVFDTRSQEELIQRTLHEALDKNIVQLQQKYEMFKVKVPLISTEEGYYAKMGLKDGVSAKHKYYAYQEEYYEDGRFKEYKKLGTFKPRKNQIWDNRYLASIDREHGNISINSTELKRKSGSKDKLQSGVLLHEGRIRSPYSYLNPKGYFTINVNYGLDMVSGGSVLGFTLAGGGYISPYFGLGASIGYSRYGDAQKTYFMEFSNQGGNWEYGDILCKRDFASRFELGLNFRGFFKDYAKVAEARGYTANQARAYSPWKPFWEANFGVYALGIENASNLGVFALTTTLGVKKGVFTMGLSYKYAGDALRVIDDVRYEGKTKTLGSSSLNVVLGLNF